MSDGPIEPASPWSDAELAASLVAVDPAGLGGVVVRALPGSVRDHWLALLRALLGPTVPLRRVPLHVPDGRLLGGLDLAATLEAGRRVVERGILAESDGGVVLLAMAERLPATVAARLGHVLDSGEVALERNGLALRSPARIGVVALDEGVASDERPPPGLLDRLALWLDLSGLGTRDAKGRFPDLEGVARARASLPEVRIGDEGLRSLCECALTLGIESLRAPLLAGRVARASAALGGRSGVSEEDARIAARLVLAPRAQSLPAAQNTAAEADESEPAPTPGTEDAATGGDAGERDGDSGADALTDRLIEAAEAAIPAGLLAQLRAEGGAGQRSRSPGKAGACQRGTRRGRPAGVQRGEPRRGARLDVVETLRAAAPWQRIRARENPSGGTRSQARSRLAVRREDFRVSRIRQRSETTTIFAVDASGSTALHRLAEAKGAVELLLGQCYVRRDRVAVIAFRGREAELLLPPTRSLVRAKRSLAGLPGGGGTPLAAGIETAAELAGAVRRGGGTPLVVLLTDGQANVTRGGQTGRAEAAQDAAAAARRLRDDALSALVIDTSPRPQLQAQRLAGDMGATYLPLPRADAGVLFGAVQEASAPGGRANAGLS